MQLLLLPRPNRLCDESLGEANLRGSRRFAANARQCFLVFVKAAAFVVDVDHEA